MGRQKIVLNVDGLEWKRTKWNGPTRAYLRASERLAVRSADEVIADNREIALYLEATYGVKPRLIEYGGDHVHLEPLDAAVRKELRLPAGPYACTVCRIEPENNVDLILDAFASVRNLPIVAVGNWAMSEYGRALEEKYRNIPNICLLPAIYDLRRLDALRSNCCAYIHGHSAGGTNPSLVEAMWLGLPIFSFDVGYNRETTEERALYYRSARELALLLSDTPTWELAKVGESMRGIAFRRYRWARIAAAYAELL
jgi:glycosyltransferase involved in cell wall biosynthesis